MKMSRRDREGVVVLSPEGRLTLVGGDVLLRKAVRGALAEGSGQILIDLGRVKLIDSSGVGELVSAHTTITRRGGKLGLVNVPSAIVELLGMTQLLGIFSIYDGEDQAIAELSS